MAAGATHAAAAPTNLLTHTHKPFSPPPFPSVDPNGKVCISILHPPGVDAQNAQETADERWRPILGVESVLVSVISMLGDPNPDSPANIDAGKMYREDPAAYKRRVRRCVERSLEQ